MELFGCLKLYEWGKQGISSKVAQLAQNNNNDFELEDDQTYAELWLGDHVNGQARIKRTGESLGTFLKQNPQFIGGLDDLPYLFKVLSVQKALSLQVNPNKVMILIGDLIENNRWVFKRFLFCLESTQDEAVQLNAQLPDIYKDANHKPQLMIALTPFIALCGFRPYKEIQDLLLATPEMIELLGLETIKRIDLKSPTGIKSCFTQLMIIVHVKVSICIKTISERYQLELRKDLFATVFQQLDRDFPNDIGILCLYFLNLFKLQPGESLFVGPNCLHAYLEGDCIECMASSDNVIRAGLTPKFKDVDTLLRIVDWAGTPHDEKLFKPVMHATLSNSRVFVPPVPEFAIIEIIAMPQLVPHVIVENRAYGSQLIVLSGSASINVHGEVIELAMGSIVFLPSPEVHDPEKRIEQFTLELKSKDQFMAFQAMYNDF